MTVRTAELLMAIFLALCSIGLMVKAAELPIGWVKKSGPGSGAWPFWLSAGMLLCCLWTIVRWFRGITPESRNTNIFVSRTALYVVGVTVTSLVVLLILSHTVGMYFGLLLFMAFYLRVMGGHSYTLSISLAILVPVIVFLFFEWALNIPIPKGISEPMFYPIYDLIY